MDEVVEQLEGEDRVLCTSEVKVCLWFLMLLASVITRN
jgi:hypothetical protein